MNESNKPTNEGTGILQGLALTAGLHGLNVVVSLTLMILVDRNSEMGWPFMFILFIGVAQLVYMIPAIVIVRRRGRLDIAKGLMIGAGMTFLLNGACYGLVMLSL